MRTKSAKSAGEVIFLHVCISSTHITNCVSSKFVDRTVLVHTASVVKLETQSLTWARSDSKSLSCSAGNITACCPSPMETMSWTQRSDSSWPTFSHLIFSEYSRKAIKKKKNENKIMQRIWGGENSRSSRDMQRRRGRVGHVYYRWVHHQAMKPGMSPRDERATRAKQPRRAESIPTPYIKRNTLLVQHVRSLCVADSCLVERVLLQTTPKQLLRPQSAAKTWLTFSG